MNIVNIESDKILNLVSACAPLRVIVTVHSIDDRYYIHFDGRSTYKDAKKWHVLWEGFEKYVSGMLRHYNIKVKNIDIKDEYTADCFIGTLFDILSTNNE